MKRKARAIWNGKGIDGTGKMSADSGAFRDLRFTAKTRFEDEPGTNPEELIAAAHAGCYTMQLSFNLQEAGYEAKELDAECIIEVKEFNVQSSHIILKAKVEGIGEEEFEKLVRHAEKNCPISKLLDTEISVEYTLN
ncbi:MAG: OsmC family peroxiredoxin [Cytophagales bacterium]